MKSKTSETNFLGKRIMVITAHPDDESFFAAGAIYKNHRLGGETFLICATAGEKGSGHLKKKITETQLAARRRQELAKSSKYLGISNVRMFNFPDGGLKFHKVEYFKKALILAKKIKPEIILSFGPDGISGHFDHIAAGWVARKISKSLKVPFIACAVSPLVAKYGKKSYLARRTHKNYAKLILPIGNIKVAINGTVKLNALRMHTSQIDGRNPFTHYPKAIVQDKLKYEYFII